MNRKRMIAIVVMLAVLAAVVVCWLLWWGRERGKDAQAAEQTEAKPQETKTEEPKTGENEQAVTGEPKAGTEEPKAGETPPETKTEPENAPEEEPAPEKAPETEPAESAQDAPAGETEEETVVYTVGEEVSTRVVTALTYEDKEGGWGFAVPTEGDEPMAHLHYRENGEEKERSFPADEELWDRILFLAKGGTLVRPAGEGPVESTLRWEGMTPEDEGLQFRPDPEKADALEELFQDMKTMEAW